MLNYTATYGSTDNNPCGNILEGIGTIKPASLAVSDYINSICVKENNDDYCMIKPESLTIANNFASDKLFGTLTDCTASILNAHETSDYAKYLGESIAALGSNAD